MLAFFVGFSASAGNSGITYQGRILKPDNTPLSGANVQFRLQIRTPDANNCLMYEEVQAQNMSQSKGNFSLTINDGSGVRNDGTGLGLDRIFANQGVFAFTPTTCSSGSGTYTPNDGDGRTLLVYFKDETMAGWEPMPPQKINYVPFAFESKQIQGFTAASLLRVQEADGTLGSVAPLSNANYTKLLDLIAGKLSGAAMPTTMTSGQVLGWNGTAWTSTDPVAGVQAFAKTALPTCGAGQFLKDNGSGLLTCATPAGSATGTVTSVATGAGLTGGPITTSGTIALATLGAGGTGFKVTYDTYGRVTAAVALVEADIPTLSAAGKVSGSAITSGAISGSTSINTSGAISTSGAIFGGSLNVGAISGTSVVAPSGSFTTVAAKNVEIYETANLYKVTLKVPTGASADYALTLPAAPGASGKILGTTGAGVLAWVDPSSASQWVNGAGGIISYSGGNVGIGTTTPSSALTVAGTITPDANATRSVGTSALGYVSMYTNFVGSTSGSTLTTNGGTQVFQINGSPKATIDSSGNFGIGTTTPTTNLSVVGSNNGSNGVIDATNTFDNNASYPTLRLSRTRSSGSTPTADFGATVQVLLQDSGGVGSTSTASITSTNWETAPTSAPNRNTYIAFSNRTADVVSEKLRISASGNVGVGTTLPLQKLDVAGAIRIGTTATCDGTLTGTIRYNGGNLEFCNGAWQTLGVSGAGITSLTGDVTSTGAPTATTTIAANAVTSGKIATGAITDTKIANYQIDSYHIKGNAIGLDRITTIAASKLLGRDSTGTGSVSQINLGTGLAMTAAGTLNVTVSDSFAALPCADGYIPQKVSGAWSCVLPTSAGTVDAIVRRDSSGNFVAGTTTLTNSLKLKDGATGGEVTLAAPSTFTSYGLTLPTTAGSNGYLLTTNGTGTLSWTNPSSVSPWTVSGADIYRASGNVGIGTTTPSAMLDVAGAIISGGTVAGSVGVKNASNGLATYLSPSNSWIGHQTGSTLAVGSATSLSTLGVKGGVAIGSTYGTTATAAAGNLLVEGNVGIGTASPLAALDVDPIGTTAALLLRQGNTSAAPGSRDQILFGYVDTNTSMHRIQSRHDSGTAAGNNLDFYLWSPADAASAPGTKHVMTMSGSGNVGIGTTSPTRLLQVAGPMRLTPTALPGSPAAGDLTFDSAASNALKFYDGTSWQTVGTATGGSYVAKAGDTMTGTLNLPANGLVVGTNQLAAVGTHIGIGTAAPSTRLHVVGNDSTNGVLIAQNNASTGYVTGFNVLGPNLTSGQAIQFKIGKAAATNQMAEFNYKYDSVTPVFSLGMYGTPDIISYLNSGNVGLGTTAPGTHLHVSGTGSQNMMVATTNSTASEAGVIYQTPAGTALTGMPGASGRILNTSVAGELIFSNRAGAIAFSTDTAYNRKDMYLSAAGNLGVGTSTPAAGERLNVTGGAIVAGPQGTAVNSAGEIRLSELAAGGTNYVGFRSPDGLMTDTVWTLPTGLGTNGQVLTTNASGVLSWTTPASGGSSQWTTSGSNISYATGNVGIGSTSTTYSLDVTAKDGDSVPAVFKGSATYSDSTIQIETYNGTGRPGILFNQPSNFAWLMFSDYPGSNLVFNPGSNANSPSANSMYLSKVGLLGLGTSGAKSRLSVNGGVAVGTYATSTPAPTGGMIVSGNVGIGTSSPSSRLHVVGPNSGGNPLVVEAAPGTGAGGFLNILLNNKTSGAWKSGIAFQNNGADKYSFGVDYTGAGVNDFSLFDNAAGATRLLVTPTGNIGIGTTTPQAGLDVRKGVGAQAAFFAVDASSRGIAIASNGAGGALQAQLSGGGATTMFLNPSGGPIMAGSAGTPAGLIGIAGNLAVGSSYSTAAPPANGLLVEGNVGIGTTTPAEKLSVSGNVLADAYLYSSDRRLKKDITQIEGSLAKVLRLNGVTYRWITPLSEEANREQMGVIAQDVEAVFPQAVTVSKDGVKRVNYPMLVAPVIEAVKELNREIASLKERAEKAESKASDLERKNLEFERRLQILEKSIRQAK